MSCAQIYPNEIYYFKEQGYDPQQVPAVQAFTFSRAVMDKKLLSPIFPRSVATTFILGRHFSNIGCTKASAEIKTQIYFCSVKILVRHVASLENIGATSRTFSYAHVPRRWGQWLHMTGAVLYRANNGVS